MILENKSKGEKFMDVDKEYQRIKLLFENTDEKQLALIDGAIREAARLKVELDGLHEIIKKTGMIRLNPNNPLQQKELPISKLIVKVRANYLNHIAKLSNILGRNIDDDDVDLEEYE